MVLLSAFSSSPADDAFLPHFSRKPKELSELEQLSSFSLKEAPNFGTEFFQEDSLPECLRAFLSFPFSTALKPPPLFT